MSYILAVFLILGVFSPAFGGSNENAKIALHLQAIPTGKAPPPCQRLLPIPACNPESSLTVQGGIHKGYDLYILVADADSAAGVAGASFGIVYGPNLYTGAWTLCGDLEFPGGPSGVTWPHSGTGNLITWKADSNCQRTPAGEDSNHGVTAILGSLYVYAYDSESFEITSRNYTLETSPEIGDCSAAKSEVALPGHAGRIGFGSNEGFDPCLNGGDNQVPPPSPPPPSLDEPSSEWSSGFDPEVRGVSWPLNIKLGKGKALFLGGSLFEQGDELMVSFDSDEQMMRINGLEWRSYRSSTISSPKTETETWVHNLYSAFAAQKATNTREKIEQAFALMDKQLLDPNFKPTIRDDSITLKFRGVDLLAILRFAGEAPKTKSPEEGAKEEALYLLRHLSDGSGPFVYVKYRDRSFTIFGKDAAEIVRILTGAKAGLLSPEDAKFAETLYLREAAEELYRRGLGK